MSVCGRVCMALSLSLSVCLCLCVASKVRKLASALAEQVTRAGQALALPYPSTVARAFAIPNGRIKDAVLTFYEKVRNCYATGSGRVGCACDRRGLAPKGGLWALTILHAACGV
jgi:hypothetical protein